MGEQTLVERLRDKRYSGQEFMRAEAAAEIERLRGALEGIQGDGKAEGTWWDIIGPLVARFQVGAKFNADVIHNGEGAAAVAQLMEAMAKRLDIACERARAALTPKEHTDDAG